MVMKLRSAGPAESKGLEKKKSKQRVSRSVKKTRFQTAVLPINLSRTSYDEIIHAFKERNRAKNLSKDKLLSILPPCPKSVKETTLAIIKWACRHSSKVFTRPNFSKFKGGYSLRSCCANKASPSNFQTGRPTTVSTRSKTNTENSTNASDGRRRCLPVPRSWSRNSTKENPPVKTQRSGSETTVSEPMSLSLNFRCLVDEDVSSYKRLQNSHQFEYIFINKKAPKLLVTRLRRSDTSSWFQHSPGVMVCPAIRVNITQPVLTHASQITICPKTVLPFVMNNGKCGILTILVLFGEIRVKSNMYDIKRDGEYFCKSVICSPGTQITVPVGSVYSIENWSAEEVLLRYNFFKEMHKYDAT